MATLRADSCSPASARMIGTPDLSSVYIWRLNNSRSSSVTRGEMRRASQLSRRAVLGAAVGAMSTGDMPVLANWSATAPVSLSSSTPVTSSPLAFLPLYTK